MIRCIPLFMTSLTLGMAVTPSATFFYDSNAAELSSPAGLPWWQNPNAGYANAAPCVAEAVRGSGYRGIWFALGSNFEYGDKYSGGLGTYTANHEPMAVYAPEVNKTFFTYGGTPAADKRELVIMVSYYDHGRGVVPRPVALYADPSVDDPHDNASLQIARDGYIWVLKSGRGQRRPGIVFRSTKPYDIGEFERIEFQEFTYPQIWAGTQGDEFFLLFTKYREGTRHGPARELFWKTSPDGRTWSQDHALAVESRHVVRR